jgi:hypothetical protein
MLEDCIMEETKKEDGVQFQAKKNCKTCYGRGFITRTFPIGTKQSGRKKDDVKESHGMKTLCHCASEIIEEKPEPVLKVNTPSPDECFVPKIAPEGSEVREYAKEALRRKQYASRAVPSFAAPK